jgi:Thiamine pyrophosphate enzyme, N-terminal TPP binding domain
MESRARNDDMDLDGRRFVHAQHLVGMEVRLLDTADAYAKATGELTVVSVHAGPGLTNSMKGIAEAAKSRTPLLVLAGDVPASDVTSTFFINQAELVRVPGDRTVWLSWARHWLAVASATDEQEGGKRGEPDAAPK